MTTDPSVRTQRAAAAVIARAARDGERVVCSARVALAIATLVAWPIWTESWAPVDWAVMGMSFGSFIFSLATLARLRGERPERNTPMLRTTSILVDATLIIGGLATFIAVPPEHYAGIAREPGLSLAYIGVVAGGIRLSYAGAIFAALVFAFGILGLLIADAGMNPEYPMTAASVLTVAGLWMCASVFSWLVARRTGKHVSDGANNAADEIHKLNLELTERVKERGEELEILRRMLNMQHDGRLAPGDVLDGRFEVEARIGGGGMGRVYRAWDRKTEGHVALKLIQPGKGDRDDLLGRFLMESKLAADVRHDAIVRMFPIGTCATHGLVFQVQELVQGITLEDLLKRRLLDCPEAARIGAVLASALGAAHARGVIHRDVKPANIMLTRAPPGLKLIDFGIAKLEHHQNETDTGAGTWGYMAPEQRARNAGKASDVYSLALVLLFSLTRRLAHANAEREEALALVSDVELRMRIRHCLEPAPELRPSALGLAGVLDVIATRLKAPQLETLDHPVAPALGDGSAHTSALLAPFAQPSSHATPGTGASEGGAIVDGCQLVERLAGPSGRGEVWRALDEWQREVAVRILPAPASTEDAIAAEDRIAELVQMSHPNVCPLLRGGLRDGLPYLITPYLRGHTLRSLLQTGLARDQARAIAFDIWHALNYLHGKDRQHGAVRAENVFVVDDTAVLMDLGSPGAQGDDASCFVALLKELDLWTAQRDAPPDLDAVRAHLEMRAN
jgi:serine/threonine protein kinase